jgi:hypothetical protein
MKSVKVQFCLFCYVDVKFGVSIAVEEHRYKTLRRGVLCWRFGRKGEGETAGSRNSLTKNAIISACCQPIQ